MQTTITQELSAFYGRVSTGKQDASLDTQDERVAAYALTKRLNLRDDLRFTDEDTSGSIPLTEREGGRRLLEAIEDYAETDTPIRHLIITKLDRLGRDSLDGELVMRRLRELGVVIHIIDLGGDSLSTSGFFGELIIKIIFAIAEWDRKNITSNIRTAMKAKRARGEATGHAPYGYDSVPTDQLNVKTGKPVLKLVPNEYEQWVIKQILSWREDGFGTHWIASELNRREIPTKKQGAAGWKPVGVWKVLNGVTNREAIAKKQQEAA